MTLYIKKGYVRGIEYDGTNYENIIKHLDDINHRIQPWISGMLNIDSEHGRLTVRKGEYIIKDSADYYSVYTKEAFEKVFKKAKG